MMLGQYLVLVGADEALQGAVASSLRARLPFRTALPTEDCVVLTSMSDLALPIPADRGIAIGTIFPRYGPARSIKLEDRQWHSELADPDVLTALRDRFWGGYIALIAQQGAIHLARDPGGAMPCYFTQLPTGWAICSDADLLIEAGLLTPSIAWNEIPRYLTAKDLPCAVTAIEGLKELLPGTCLTLAKGQSQVTPFWSPWDHVAEPEIWDGPATAERLRRVVDHCVAAWASTTGRGLATLSGGLDSSIVVAGLARSRRDFCCATLVTENRNGDERDYARAMADAAGAELLEVFYDHEDVDLSRSVARHFPKPIGQIHEVAYHAAIMRMAQASGADAVFTGNGGDNVFYNSSSIRPLFDLLGAVGPGIEAARTFRNICAVTEASPWAAIREAVRSVPAMRRPYRWHQNFEMLDPGLILQLQDAPPRHAWLDQQRPSRPGKAGQVAFLLRVQNHLEGYLRTFGMPMINPLMSQPVVEMALGIPTWKMVEGGRDRAVARAAYADTLPPLVRDRRRKGSPSGFAMAVLERKPQDIRERLMDGELVRRSLVSADAVEAAIARGPAMGLSYVRLLTLLDMEAWIGHWRAKAP